MNARWTISQARGGVREFAISGDIDMAVEDELDAALRACAHEAARRGAMVRIDLSAVEFMDSAGLRSLMRLHIDHGAVTRIVSVSGPVARLFEVAGVGDWLMSPDDFARATRDLAAARPPAHPPSNP